MEIEVGSTAPYHELISGSDEAYCLGYSLGKHTSGAEDLLLFFAPNYIYLWLSRCSKFSPTMRKRSSGKLRYYRRNISWMRP